MNTDTDADNTRKMEDFLLEYAQCGVVGPALRAVGATRADLRCWRKEDKFRERLQEAHDDAVDEAEAELRSRAVEGWDEPVLYKGEPVWARNPDTGSILMNENFEPVPFTVRKHSDRLLEVYVQSHIPEYRPKSEVALTGPRGGPIEEKRDITVRYMLPDGKTAADYDGIAVDSNETEDWLK